MTGLWRRLRDAYRRSGKRRDELAGEKVLLEHERQERGSVEAETPIPPMRSTNDWSGWSGPTL
jgi:hypothetical protein